MKYNTMFDVAFTAKHDCEDPHDVPKEDLIKALEQRIETLRNSPQDAAEAFGVSDTYEEMETPTEQTIASGTGINLGPAETAIRIRLKWLLMEMGNRLCQDHGYIPASVACEETESDIWSLYGDETTLLHFLTVWLNDPQSPERRELLKALNCEWPMPEDGVIDAKS